MAHYLNRRRKIVHFDLLIKCKEIARVWTCDFLGTFFILELGGEANDLYGLCNKNNVVRKISPISGMVDEDRVYQISITCKEDAERDIRLSYWKIEFGDLWCKYRL